MTQPWWPGSGEPPAPTVPSNPAPWMPPPAAGQNRQQGQNHPQQATPWAPPPTMQSPTAMPTGEPAGAGTPVSTVDSTDPTAIGTGSGPRQNVPGLGFVNFLLVMGTLAFAAFIVREWVMEWVRSLVTCVDGGGAWECISNDAGRTQVLLPIVAILASFALSRGAGIERQQGRGIGWLYVLLGFGAVGLAWTMGTSA